MNENLNIDEHQNYPDSEQKIEVPTMKVIPLKKICMTIGQLPTAYLETMSYYEMLIWFIEYLKNNIIPTINNNASAVQEVQNVVMNLQTYINNFKNSIDEDVEGLEEYMNNYFDNLDVQEEINNKLDEMLEDGVLEQIIEQFIQSTAIWCFDTVADMKQATNLINGSFARTLGYYEVNDDGGAIYKITDTASGSDYQEELESGLYATLIVENVLNVKQIGAYGDDEHDDTTIIQYALNNYENILIPKGIFRITGITIPNKTTLKGLKKTEVKLKYYGTNNGSIIKIGSLSDNGHYVTIDNISFIQNTGITGVNGIEFMHECAYSVISNCYFKDLSGDGIKAGHTNHVNNIEIVENYFTNCENNINMQYMGYQINAIWIHHNNIVAAKKNGILFAGNNVIIESNTIQANKKHGISIGDSSWNETYSQSTFGSVIKDNYFEQNGNNFEYPVIGIYSGYLSNRTYNRLIRKLTITNNYFLEINTNRDNNIIYCTVDLNTFASSKACEIIAENNYSTTTKFIGFNFINALSYGSIIKNNSNNDDLVTYPYYVLNPYFEKNSPEKKHDDGYQNSHYSDNGTIPANSTTQNTYLIYFESDTLTQGELNRAIRQTYVDIVVNGNNEYGAAGRYNAYIRKIGSNVAGNDGSITKEIQSGSETTVPNISPLTLVEGMSEISGNATLGLQFTLSSRNNVGFPYALLMNIKCQFNYIKYLKIKRLTPDIKQGSTAPSGDINYIGQVYVNNTDRKWYVASDLSTWREASTN